MPQATYIPLATITLSSTDSQIDFANIPNTYRDLVITSNMLTTADTVTGVIRFNGVTTSTYNAVQMYGLGSGSGASGSQSNQTSFSDIFGRTSPGFFQMQIFDYAQTDKHKSGLIRVDQAAYATYAAAVRWANTAAITSISIAPSGASWTNGATFSLFGIAG